MKNMDADELRPRQVNDEEDYWYLLMHTENFISAQIPL
jgi:hypothetical protein